MNFDICVIGGGPAGLTAGIYAARADLKTAIFERGNIGGRASLAHNIENYPGFPGGISGTELMQRFLQQAVDLGAILKESRVIALEIGEGEHILKTVEDEFSSKALIIATGVQSAGGQAKAWDIPGEQEFTGRGVSYCATCDAVFFRGKKVGVVGDGDTAVEEAIFLTKFADEVHLLYQRDKLRADEQLQWQASENKKIIFRGNTKVKEIRGNQLLEELQLENRESGEISNESFNGLFIYAGNVPNTGFIQDKVEKDKQGYIIVGEDLSTNIPGIFAAGDAREKDIRQVSTAVGDGAAAAVNAEKYIE